MYKYEHLLSQLGITGTIVNKNLQNIFNAKTFEHLGFYFRYTNKADDVQEIAKILVDPVSGMKEITEIYKHCSPGDHIDVRNNISLLTSTPDKNLDSTFLYQAYNVDVSTTGPKNDVKVRNLIADDSGIYYDILKEEKSIKLLNLLNLPEDWMKIEKYNLIVRFDNKGIVQGFYHHFEGEINEILRILETEPIIASVVDNVKLAVALDVLIKQANNNKIFAEPKLMALGLQQKWGNQGLEPAHKFIVELI